MRKELCSARVTTVVWIILSRVKWQMLRNWVDEGWRSSRRSQKINWLRVLIQPFARNLTSIEPLGRWIRKTWLDSASFKWKLSELQNQRNKRENVCQIWLFLSLQSLGRLLLIRAFSARLGKNKRITQKRSSHYESWKRRAICDDRWDQLGMKLLVSPKWGERQPSMTNSCL